VPVTPREDIGGLAKRLGLPVIIVARASLGTINHSVLTLEAVQRDGCSVAALVMSRRPDEDSAFAQSNAQQITRWWKGLVLTYEGDDAALDPLFHPKRS
jgi:dethiobiotin synthetase